MENDRFSMAIHHNSDNAYALTGTVVIQTE